MRSWPATRRYRYYEPSYPTAPSEYQHDFEKRHIHRSRRPKLGVHVLSRGNALHALGRAQQSHRHDGQALPGPPALEQIAVGLGAVRPLLRLYADGIAG